MPFEHWRKLDVQLTHLWNSGQGQEIYSHSSTGDNSTTQEQVIELLSWWQQYACFEPRSVRMVLNLVIDHDAVRILPFHTKALSPTKNIEFLKNLSRTGSHTKTLLPHLVPDTESDGNFKTVVYENIACLDVDLHLEDVNSEDSAP